MKDKQLLLAVLAQLEREKAVSIPQLALLLGVSEDEVTQALDALVYAYDSASIRLDLRETFATLETYGTDRMLRLSAPEADALVDALASAGFTQDDELVQSLLDAKSVLGDAESASEPRLHIIASVSTPQVTEALSAACEDSEHHLVEISYRGVKDDEPQTRVVEPYAIFSEDDHRYLLAFCHDADDWRSFRIDRVESVAQLEERFAPRGEVPGFAVNIERSSQPATIRLAAGCALPSWRDMRVIETQPDGSCVVQVPWTGSPWLAKQIVALMGDATVVAPQTLERACEAYARSLL